MKTAPVSILALALLVLAGCTTITPEQSALVRFVRAPEPLLSRSIADEAAARKFRQMADGRWEQVIMREKDPVLGLVTVSENAQLALRFSTAIEPVTGDTCRLRAYPVSAMKHYLSEKYTERPIPANRDLIALIDTAVANAETEFAKRASMTVPR